MEKGQKDRLVLHQPVDSTFYVFTTLFGEKVLQIDTFGSSHREFQGKVSQSVQFDRKSAEKLFRILKEEFQLK